MLLDLFPLLLFVGNCPELFGLMLTHSPKVAAAEKEEQLTRAFPLSCRCKKIPENTTRCSCPNHGMFLPVLTPGVPTWMTSSFPASIARGVSALPSFVWCEG